jgi:hypothetical protein
VVGHSTFPDFAYPQSKQFEFAIYGCIRYLLVVQIFSGKVIWTRPKKPWMSRNGTTYRAAKEAVQWTAEKFWNYSKMIN